MKRKIAAILAADIVGFSRLVGDDEEDTLRRLENYRAVFSDFIARFGGRIFNTAGDAILAEFSSAVDAVRCAVDTQESLRTRNLAYPASRQMHFRIGITIGDVVEREGDLLGEGVNIASRLESIAPAGGICVSRSVHEAVANKISLKFSDVGEQQLKNLPDRVHAYMLSLEMPGAGGVRLRPIRAHVRPLWGALAAAIAAALVAGGYLIAESRRDTDSPARTAEAPVATTPAQIAPPAPPPEPQKEAQTPPPPAVEAAAKPEVRETAKPAPPAEIVEEEDDPSVSDDTKCADVDKEKRAIAACTRLLDAGGVSRNDRARYLSNRGAAHLNLRDYDLAMEDLNESVLLRPSEALANYNRGATYFFMEKYDAAVTDLQRAAKLNSKHDSTHYYLGRSLYALGRYDEGLTHLTKAIALAPKEAAYYRYRADIHLDKGNYDKAVADYDRAIDLKPKYAMAFRGRGIAWRSAGNTGKAIADLDEAVRLDPDDWFALYQRAGTYVAEGRFRDAVTDQTEALRLDPNNARLLNARADAILRDGRPNEAMPDVEHALRLDPKYAMAITTRGEIQEALGARELAIADFKDALAIDSTLEEAKNGLARLEPGTVAVSGGAAPDAAVAKSNSASTCTRFLASVGKTISAPCSD